MAQEITLITGASSGIGEALAHRVARDGRHVALVARRTDRLRTLAARVAGAYGVEAHVLAADLTHPDAGRTLAEEIERRGLVVEWLVNNAGFGTQGRFHQMPIDRELEEIRLNVMALVELTGRFLPGMVARKRGAVINVASLAAFTPGPYMATYCATKAFVLSFTEALAAEVNGTGVHVLVVCPGFTRTEFQAKAEVDVGGVPDFAWMSAEEVADQAVRAVGQRTVLVNGTLNSLTAGAMRILPSAVTSRVIGGIMRAREG